MATPFTFFIKMYERRGGLRTPDPKTPVHSIVHSIVHDTYTILTMLIKIVGEDPTTPRRQSNE